MPVQLLVMLLTRSGVRDVGHSPRPTGLLATGPWQRRGRSGLQLVSRKPRSRARWRTPHATYFFFVPYGLWFVGFSEMFSSDAFCCTAAGVLPRCSARTRVGVLCLTSCFICRRSAALQSLPWFLGVLVIISSLVNGNFEMISDRDDGLAFRSLATSGLLTMNFSRPSKSPVSPK